MTPLFFNTFSIVVSLSRKSNNLKYITHLSDMISTTNKENKHNTKNIFKCTCLVLLLGIEDNKSITQFTQTSKLRRCHHQYFTYPPKDVLGMLC